MDYTTQLTNESNLAKQVRTNLLIFIDSELFNDKRKKLPILINSKTSEQLKKKYEINNFYQTIDTEIFFSNNKSDEIYQVSVNVNKKDNSYNIVSHNIAKEGEKEESDEMKIKRAGIYYLYNTASKRNKINHKEINEILENETFINKKIKIGNKKINKSIQINNSSKSIQKENNNEDRNKITEFATSEQIPKDNFYSDRISGSSKNCSNYDLIKLEIYCNSLIDIKEKEHKNNDIKQNETKKDNQLLKTNEKKEDNELKNSEDIKINNIINLHKSPSIGKSKFHCNKLAEEKESPNKKYQKDKDQVKVQSKFSCKIKKFNSIKNSKTLKFNLAKHEKEKEKLYLSPDIKTNKKIKKESSSIMILQKPKLIKFLSPEIGKKGRNSNKQCSNNKQKSEMKRDSPKKITAKSNFMKSNKNNNINSPKVKKHKMTKEILEFKLENNEDSDDDENNIIKLLSINENEHQPNKTNNENEEMRYSFRDKLANEINKINLNSPDIKKKQHNFNRSNTIRNIKSAKDNITDLKFNTLNENKGNKKIRDMKLKTQNKNKNSDEK